MSEVISASLDYYVIPYLKRKGIRYRVWDKYLIVTCASLFQPKTVIIVRYIPKEAHKKIIALHKKGYRFVYFMDDDLMDPNAWVCLPSKYAKRIEKEAYKHRKFLERICSEFWVSTVFLAQKYNHWQAKVLTPIASVNLQNKRLSTWVCYHGTTSHQMELKWLSVIVTQLQKQTDYIRFELFGDHSIYTLYRDVPRVSVLHPMSWPNYLHYTQSVKRDIALAPLLADPFNSGRGVSKFFDITRMGAVGLYSNVAPYAGFIRHGVDGFLIGNDPEEWLDIIVFLSNNPEQRKQMLAAAQERIKISYNQVVL